MSNYKVYEVKTNKGEVKRIYAPSTPDKLLSLIDWEVLGVKDVNTTKTVDYLFTRRIANSWNNLVISEVLTKNITLEELLGKFNPDKSLITESNLDKVVNSYSSLNKQLTTLKYEYPTHKGILRPLEVSINKEYFTSLENKKTLLTIPSSSKPLPLGVQATTSKAEDNLLNGYLNYYLKSMGLKTVKNQNIEQGTLFKLSTIGDKYYDLHLLELGYLPAQTIYYASNKFQQMLLVTLGFPEMFTVTEHLAGTFFEVIYYAAVKQKNHEVLNKISEKILKLAIPTENEVAYVDFED